MVAETTISWTSVIGLSMLFGFWLVGLVAYGIRVRIKGRFSTPKVQQKGGSWLLGVWAMEYGYWMMHWLGRLMIGLGVSANQITAVSLVMAFGAALALYNGWFGVGGWLIIGAGICDVLDGMVARKTQTTSTAGVFLDTIMDRYCELLIFVALMAYYFPLWPAFGLIVGLAMIASLMITFTRTKGEALGITDIPSGLMRRHERLLYLGVGTAASPLLAAALEPGATRPIYHLALMANGIVASCGSYVAIQLGVQIYRRLRPHEPDEFRGVRFSSNKHLGE